MDFSTSIKEEEYILNVKKFISDRIKHNISTWYKNETFPLSILKDIYSAGLMGFYETGHKMEQEPMAHSIILYEKLAEISPGFTMALLCHAQIGLYLLYRWGNIWQKQQFMLPGIYGQKLFCFASTEQDAGSDVSAIKMQAKRVKGGFILTGEKMYVTNGGDANFIIVSAVTDSKTLEKKNSISLFILDERNTGIKRTVLKKSIWVPSNLAKLTFEECFVPEENILGNPNSGFKIMMKTFNSARISMSALNLGTALGAYKLALSHACERTVFGSPVFEHQAKSFEFAEHLTKLEAARLLIKKAAWMRDTGQKYILNSSIAKYFTIETAKSITGWSAEILGARSILLEHPVNKYTIDTMGSVIGLGTGDIQKLIIARFMHMWDNWE
jgi:alkylation response protein AidB-like acyl-CoA dehydrogenase